MREVEVLYDQLLDCFETMPNLRPRDIVVMTPEIEKYAPFIRGVFGYYYYWASAKGGASEFESGDFES